MAVEAPDVVATSEDAERQELLCKASRLAYPVRDGIPVMLEEEARTLTDEELARLR